MARAARAAAVAVLAVALGAVTAGPAAAVDERPSLECGVMPTEDVVLRSDLTCPTGFYLDPGAAIDVDLAGHTFTRSSCGSGSYCVAISNAGSVHDGAVVQDLFDIGSIDRVRVDGNIEMGSFSNFGPPMSVTRSTVDGHVRLWRPDQVVDHNIIRGMVSLNDTETGVRNATVTSNWIFGGGISMVPIPIDDPWELSGDLSDNLVVGSPGPGIQIGSVLQNIGPTTVSGNLVVRSGGDGISIAPNPFTMSSGHAPATVRVERNLLVANAGHGIANHVPPDSPLLVIEDGGGNRAVANRTPPPCVGITCTRAR